MPCAYDAYVLELAGSAAAFALHHDMPCAYLSELASLLCFLPVLFHLTLTQGWC